MMVGCNSEDEIDKLAISSEESKVETPKSEDDEEIEEKLITFKKRKEEFSTYIQRDEKNKAADEKYSPKIIDLGNGTQIQRTSINAKIDDRRLVESWNNLYLNADSRGCTACHRLEDALEGMETFHGIIYFGYPVEQSLQNCYGCHSTNRPLKDPINVVHSRIDVFNDMKGNFQSCHYIDDDGNYLNWDDVKFDLLRGIERIDAKDIVTDFTWDQTKITEFDNMYYKSSKSAPEDWLTDDSQITEDIFNNWSIKFTGDLENSFEMTLPELIEEFGTEKYLMKNFCTVNGLGQPMIYQAEVTGIPIDKIMKYAKASADVNLFSPIGDDGYLHSMKMDTFLKGRKWIISYKN